MNPLRILYANAGLGDSEVERYTYDLMHAMRDQGHHVEALCPPQAQLKQRLEQDGFKVHGLTITGGWGVWRNAFTLKGFLAAQRFDVVHTQSHSDTLHVGIAARLAGGSLVVRTQHLSQSYSALASRWLPHRVIASSQFVKNTCVQKGVPARHIEVVYPAVVTPNSSAVVNLRQRLGLANEAVLIGSTVLAHQEKSALELIQALAPLMRARAQLHLIVTNETSQHDLLSAFAEQLGVGAHVHQLQAQESISSFMHELDVFALATPNEASALMFAAAAAAQVAVVATQAGSIPEMMAVGQSGMLVPVHDIVALRKALQRVIDDPDLRQSMAMAGYEYTVGSGRFTLPTMQQLIENHYRQWLRQRNP